MKRWSALFSTLMILYWYNHILTIHYNPPHISTCSVRLRADLNYHFPLLLFFDGFSIQGEETILCLAVESLTLGIALGQWMGWEENTILKNEFISLHVNLFIMFNTLPQGGLHWIIYNCVNYREKLIKIRRVINKN